MKTSNGTECKIISLTEYRRKKENKLKDIFRDSMDNDAIMQRYRIQQPTIEERQERLKESIQRINNLMKELNDKCST